MRVIGSHTNLVVDVRVRGDDDDGGQQETQR